MDIHFQLGILAGMALIQKAGSNEMRDKLYAAQSNLIRNMLAVEGTIDLVPDEYLNMLNLIDREEFEMIADQASNMAESCTVSKRFDEILHINETQL